MLRSQWKIGETFRSETHPVQTAGKKRPTNSSDEEETGSDHKVARDPFAAFQVEFPNFPEFSKISVPSPRKTPTMISLKPMERLDDEKSTPVDPPIKIPVEAIRAPAKPRGQILAEELERKIEFQRTAYAEVIGDLNARNVSLVHENEWLKEQVRLLGDQMTEMEKVRDATEKNAERTIAMQNEAILKLNQDAETITELKGELARYRDLIKAASVRRTSAEDRIKQMAGELNTLHSLVPQLERDRARFLLQMGHARQSNVSAPQPKEKEEDDQKDSRIRELENEVAGLKTQANKDLQTTRGLDSMATQFRTIKAENTNLKHWNADLSKKLEESQSRMESTVITEEDAKLLEWYQHLVSDRQRLKTDLADRDTQLLKAQAGEREARIAEEALKRDNTKYVDLNARLEQKLESLNQVSGMVLQIDASVGGAKGVRESFSVPVSLVLRLKP